MSATAGTVPPPVSWAQRNDLIYITIDVECQDIDHKVTDNTFHFKGVNALDNTKKYDVTLTFLRPVEPERTTYKNIGRCLEFTIYKKESGPYWPSLTADKTKKHFLKANFSKWKNESDDEDDSGMPFENLMNPAMNDWNNKFDDFNVDDDDSDDNIPSLSQNDEDDEDEKNDKDEKETKEPKEPKETKETKEPKAEK